MNRNADSLSWCTRPRTLASSRNSDLTTHPQRTRLLRTLPHAVGWLIALAGVGCSPDASPDLGAGGELPTSTADRVRAATLVELGSLEQGEISARIVLQADVEADLRVDVYPKVGPAYIREVLVDEGDEVRKGQPLLLLNDVDFALEVKRRDALLRQRIESERQSGHIVKETEARVRAQRAQFDRAKGDFERAKESQASGIEVLTEKEMQDAEAEFAAQEAELDAMGLSVERGEIEHELARIAVEQARIELESAQKDLRDCTVVSPIDGVVQRRDVNAGLLVNSGTHLFTLVDPSKLRAYLSVPQDDLAVVSRTGLQVEFDFPALPGRNFVGWIEAINPTVDPTNGQNRMRVRLPDEAIGVVKPGMYAKCRVLVENKKQAVLINKRSIQHERGKKWIFAYEDGKARRMTIETGASTANEEEVLKIDGREPDLGMKIIVVGQDRLRDGDLVEVVGDSS